MEDLYWIVGMVIVFLAVFLVVTFWELEQIRVDTAHLAENTSNVNDNIVILNDNMVQAMNQIPNLFRTDRAITKRQSMANLREVAPAGMGILKTLGIEKIGSASPDLALMIEGAVNEVTQRVTAKIPDLLEKLLKPAAKVVEEVAQEPSPETPS